MTKYLLVVRSVDGGLTWQIVLSHGAFPFTVRFGAGAAFVATQHGILRSDDGGATWSPRGSPLIRTIRNG